MAISDPALKWAGQSQRQLQADGVVISLFSRINFGLWYVVSGCAHVNAQSGGRAHMRLCRGHWMWASSSIAIRELRGGRVAVHPVMMSECSSVSITDIFWFPTRVKTF